MAFQCVGQYFLGFGLGQAEEKVEAVHNEAQLHLEKQLGVVAHVNAANPMSGCQQRFGCA